MRVWAGWRGGSLSELNVEGIHPCCFFVVTNNGRQPQGEAFGWHCLTRGPVGLESRREQAAQTIKRDWQLVPIYLGCAESLEC